MTTDTLPGKLHGNFKLCDSLIIALSQAIAKGNYLVTACNLVGVTDETVRNWVNQAFTDEEAGLTAEDSLFIRLHLALKKAEAEAESKLVNVVRESAEVDRNWIAGMTFLERRHPDRWGRRDRIQGGGNTYNINIEKALVDASGKLEAALGQLVERKELPEAKESER